jgi:hypothetical protein
MNTKNIRVIASDRDQRFCQDQDGLILNIVARATVVQIKEARAAAWASFRTVCEAAARATQ